MKRTYVFLAVALVSAASAATVASAQSNLPAAHSSAAATVQLRHTSLGSILVNSSGRTLYEFTRDHGNKNSCAAISGCSSVWPSLKASSRPTAGSGVKASLLSTTSGHQVTYAGHPLYTYSWRQRPREDLLRRRKGVRRHVVCDQRLWRHGQVALALRDPAPVCSGAGQRAAVGTQRSEIAYTEAEQVAKPVDAV